MPSPRSTSKDNDVSEVEDEDDRPLIALKKDRALKEPRGKKGSDVDTDGGESDDTVVTADQTVKADETLVSTDISAIALQSRFLRFLRCLLNIQRAF